MNLLAWPKNTIHATVLLHYRKKSANNILLQIWRKWLTSVLLSIALFIIGIHPLNVACRQTATLLLVARSRYWFTSRQAVTVSRQLFL